MTWDVTVADTLAVSYLPATSSTAGDAAEGAAKKGKSRQDQEEEVQYEWMS